MKSNIVLLAVIGTIGIIEAIPFFDRKSNSERDDEKCGYESCPVLSPDMLNVHLVAHSHDDVGWLKTVDQYYYGSKTMIQKAGVQYIIDSVVQELIKDPQKKFIYVEAAFFYKWWHEQTPELQAEVKVLVNEGRLEFVGGAWSMNDEAASHYHSIIDQFSWGLRFWKDTFGKCGRPKVGWQIDPFGHSREMASLFSQMGYDGQFIGRLDYQDKNQRLKTKTMEMIWDTSNNLEDNELFTGVLYNGYSPPPGFCFDILCADEPIIDDPLSTDYNVEKRVDDFLEYIEKQAKYYESKNIILTMGGDFTYQTASVYYKNLDKLMRHSNDRQKDGSKINVFYSTPSCYLKALSDAKIEWPVKTDDFFPYSSDPHAFWTGYFTSRPTHKRYERIGNQFLQVCKQLTVLAPVSKPNFIPQLNELRDVMGVLQHHDAVTGTEKQHVADDYALLLSRAISSCASNIKDVLNQLLNIPEERKNPKFNNVISEMYGIESCHYLNISSCEVSEKSFRFIVTLYNPLPHFTSQYIRIPVTGTIQNVKNGDSEDIPFQLVPIPESVLKLKGRNSRAVDEVVFLARDIPPLGYVNFLISKPMPFEEEIVVKNLYAEPSEIVIIGNKDVTISFDENGLLNTVTMNGVSSRMRQQFFYYEGAVGNNEIFENRSSGAYIFRPNNTQENMFEKVEIKVVLGEIVQEVHQVFNEWISQVVRIYTGSNHIEFEWMVGPIPIDDNIGKEIVSKFSSILSSAEVFHTDSNGREMIKRVRSHRETWNLELEEQIAGNYYPVTSKLALEDGTKRFAILNDRAQGGSSLKDGDLELMVHRRLLKDDAFGVGEALNETVAGEGLVARGKHYLFYGAKKFGKRTLKAQERVLQLQTLLPCSIFFSDTMDFSNEKVQTILKESFTGLSIPLPENVHLLTLEPWSDDSVLVRFEHFLEKDDDPELSKPVKFNISDIFGKFDITDVVETTLSANQLKSEAKKLKFTRGTKVPQSTSTNDESPEKVDTDVIILPMEIKTFIMKIKYKL